MTHLTTGISDPFPSGNETENASPNSTARAASPASPIIHNPTSAIDMSPFVESNDIIDDSEALRRRADRDGYLFLRNFVDGESILETRQNPHLGVLPCLASPKLYAKSGAVRPAQRICVNLRRRNKRGNQVENAFHRCSVWVFV